jgi:diguanylate cyclase (GGDEF)-like protein
MPRKDIDFRELLERVLPIEALPPADRLHVQRALTVGVADQIEQAAHMALAELERHGLLRRIPQPTKTHPPVLQYQSRGRLDIITVPIPSPSERDGIVRFPKSSLPARAHTALHQVRRLLRLDEPLFSSDPRTGDPRAALMQHLDGLGQELLGAYGARFLARPQNGDAAADDPMSPEAFAEALAHPGVILYCPDTARCGLLREAAARLDVRSAVYAAVAPPADTPFGVLEVRHPRVDAFRPESLALVSLIADSCAGALERATRIEKLVFVDPMTGVYNRPYFELQLRNEMARAQRERASLALCIVDIDDFKTFNTTFGYEAGNQVLIDVAQTLRGAVRPFDTVARWGGEEFGVLLTPPVHIHDVRAISERLRALVEHHLVRLEALDGTHHRVGVTVSIGVAAYPDHESTPQGLWRAANQALLVAKRPPKNQVVFHGAA